MIRRRFSVTFLLGAVVVAMVVGVASAAAGPAAPPGTPTAVSFAGVSEVGAIFDGGLSNAHTCSASVVHSPRRDLVLTAAHCVSGTGHGLLFAPGYLDGRTPFGVWTVQKMWVNPAWIRTQDPHQDYAFLQVAPQRINARTVDVELVTGGSLLGLAPNTGTKVTDIAYPYGLDDAPIQCTTTITMTAGYPTFDCHGYPDGTSGSPFLITRVGLPSVVVGVIGGLNEGGCYEWNSFSSPFGAQTYQTYLRAVLGVPGDTVPAAGGDGC